MTYPNLDEMTNDQVREWALNEQRLDHENAGGKRRCKSYTQTWIIIQKFDRTVSGWVDVEVVTNHKSPDETLKYFRRVYGKKKSHRLILQVVIQYETLLDATER